MYIHIYVYTSPESIYMPIKANEFILKALISDGITGLILFLPLSVFILTFFCNHQKPAFHMDMVQTIRT